jgi:ABC-2 type transport system permease protein
METMNNQLATSKNSSYMSFNNYSSVDAAKTAISQGKIHGAFVIPPGFSNNVTNGQPGNVLIYVDNSNPQNAASIEQVSLGTMSGLNGVLADTNVLKLSSVTNPVINPQAVIAPYTPNIVTTIPGSTNYFNFLAPGLMIMIGMMAVMIGSPEAISKEKEMGTFDGMLSAPINHLSVLLGKTTALSLRGLIQVIFVLIFAVLLFGDDTRKPATGISHGHPGYFQLYRNRNYGRIHGWKPGNRYADYEPDHVPHDVFRWYLLPNITNAMVYAGYL